MSNSLYKWFTSFAKSDNSVSSFLSDSYIITLDIISRRTLYNNGDNNSSLFLILVRMTQIFHPHWWNIFHYVWFFSDIDNSIMLRILFSFVTGYQNFLKIWNHSWILSNPFCPKSLLIMFFAPVSYILIENSTFKNFPRKWDWKGNKWMLGKKQRHRAPDLISL